MLVNAANNGVTTMYKNKAMTLIELLVILAILGIIFSLTTPSLQQFMEQYRHRAVGHQLFSSLNYARSIAIFRQRYVVLCTSSDNISCNNTKDWSSGAIIFIDDNGNKTREDNEELLQRINPVPTGSALHFANARSYLVYKPNGGVQLAGNFKYCPANNLATLAWTIIFSLTGRPYFGRDKNDDGIAEDTDSKNLTCPIATK